MAKKINTGGRANGLGGIFKDFRQKAKTNPLIKMALTKLSNSTKDELRQFLVKSLEKTKSDIFLEATKYLDVEKFLTSKKKGGVFFNHINPGIEMNRFDDCIKNSPAKNLGSYIPIGDVTMQDIMDGTKIIMIYEEVDFAHIKQICMRHLKGEKLLDEKALNCFLVRNKAKEVCEVSLFKDVDGWIIDGWPISTQELYSRLRKEHKYQFFFGN